MYAVYIIRNISKTTQFIMAHTFKDFKEIVLLLKY